MKSGFPFINLFYYALIAIFIIGCQKEVTDSTVENSKIKDHKMDRAKVNVPDAAVAVKFINDYLNNSNKMAEAVDIIDWTAARNDVTKSFKNEVKRIIDEAFTDDPELGLDADPIIDAQDYDDKGMELESIDVNTAYLIVKGKELKDFKITLRLKKVDGKWLVDGSGIINIPADKRAPR